ncbi:MAG: glycosyltransferase involved in cell wall biosynthesis [Parasphingorhabdus sp.]|jgi:glycosyltransferase involved in cell wall biosynthesis
MTVVFDFDPVVGETGMGLMPPVAIFRVDANKALEDVFFDKINNSALALICKGEVPIGQLALPVSDGCCPAGEIQKAILEKLSDSYFNQVIIDEISHPVKLSNLSIDDILANTPGANDLSSNELITVAVCTRNRPDEFTRCLKSILNLSYPNYEVVVIDNAPKNDTVQLLIESNYPAVRYIRELTPGLSHARNAALAAAKGRIVAFTDDDAVADKNWLTAIARTFAASTEVSVVTGLVIPLQLKNEAQLVVERYWSFNRGFQRKWFRSSGDLKASHVEAFQYGAGVNMAIDRQWAVDTGGFEVKLGAGTPNGGGEDMDIFFRALLSGRALVYEPAALVHHRHRDTWQGVENQITAWGKGYGAYLRRCLRAYPMATPVIWKYLYFCLKGQLGNLVERHLVPCSLPKQLLRANFSGWLRGFFQFGRGSLIKGQIFSNPRRNANLHWEDKSTTIRTVNLANLLHPLDDLGEFNVTKVRVYCGRRLLGELSFDNAGQAISIPELQDSITRNLGLLLVKPDTSISDGILLAEFREKLRVKLQPEKVQSDSSSIQIQNELSISVVIPTCNRPELLSQCLDSLSKQNGVTDIEIVVVDNNPEAGLVEPIVANFPNVILVKEYKAGAANARNSGCKKSKGDIIALLDDDVIAPPDWASNILLSFVREDVFAVAGNILPWRLDTRAEKIFEFYMGFGRGFEVKYFGPGFFTLSNTRAVPVWSIGNSANLAFRRKIILFEETGEIMSQLLGPGTATRAGEDLYFIYSILKEGYTVKYDPEAYVYHQHRPAMSQLYRQAYNYGRGHYAYQTMSLFRDGDFRALLHMLAWYPGRHLTRLIGLQKYPRTIVLLEFFGNLIGPWSLLFAVVRRWALAARLRQFTRFFRPSE